MDWYKTVAFQEIDKHVKSLHKLSNKLWTHATPKSEEGEEDTVACITKLLKKNNFHVKLNLNGMPNTFKAEYGAPSSPGNRRANVCFLCRYDTAGNQNHVHGNNLVAEVAVAAALGVKAALMLSCPTIGKVTVIGCPDVIKGGVATLVNLRVFKDVDVVIVALPGPRTDWSPRSNGRKTFLATYKGKPADVKNKLPPADEQNACILAHQNVMNVQQHFASRWIMKVTVGRTGQPKESRVVVCVTAPSNAELFFLEKRIKPCLESAGQATGCRCETGLIQKTYYSLMNNVQLCYLLQLNAYFCGTMATPLKPKPIMEPVDVANVSHVVPTLVPMFYFGSDAEVGTPEFKQALRSPEAQHHVIAIAKALAMTAVDVLETPEVLAKVKDELVQSLAEEKTAKVMRPFVIPTERCPKNAQMPLPFDTNTGWSKQP